MLLTQYPYLFELSGLIIPAICPLPAKMNIFLPVVLLKPLKDDCQGAIHGKEIGSVSNPRFLIGAVQDTGRGCGFQRNQQDKFASLYFFHSVVTRLGLVSVSPDNRKNKYRKILIP